MMTHQRSQSIWHQVTGTFELFPEQLRFVGINALNSENNAAERIARVCRRLLGCRHSHMSRRYFINDEPYSTCLECGARRPRE